MYLLDSAHGIINWKQLLLGDADWNFLLETVLRTVIMFLIILSGLRILGKRGVKQLSVFELVVIIGLGSAAGDPMLYKDVGLLPALIVFLLVIFMYSIINYFVGKSKKFETIIEGKPVCLIREGRFAIENFEKEKLAQDEFFSELRLKNVSHLGQVEQAIIETSGQISAFYYSDEEVKFGLPILPGTFEQGKSEITRPGFCACTFCGYTEDLKITKEHTCPTCKRKQWVEASKHLRIS